MHRRPSPWESASVRGATVALIPRPFPALSAAPWGALLLLVALALPGDLAAQTLGLKRTLLAGVAPGCVLAEGSRTSLAGRRDNAEARRYAAQGQEASLVGDRRAARDAFQRAAALNPGDERIAYDLGRAHEELGGTTAAVTEYCRYLALSPNGREAGEVRSRLPALVSGTAARTAARAQERFRTGVAEFDARRYGNAANAFEDVLRSAPNTAEAHYNRGIARAAAGHRDDAVKDLEAYLVAAPTAEDRADVVRAIGALQRPVYSPGAAFTRGMVPGFGQFYTGRPGRGVVVMGLVAGAVGAALYERTLTREVPYVDPNGVSVPYTQTYVERPYLPAGIAAAAVVTLGAAWEAMRFAGRSQGGIARLSPTVGVNGSVGVRLRATF